MKCTNSNCGYEWKSRTKSPKSCPRCKNYLKLRNVGERNGQWKGDAVGYGALHDYVKSHLQRPLNCENCGLHKKLEIANRSGEYKRDLMDWEWLCRKCHMMKDGRASRLRFTGHKHTDEFREKIRAIHKGKPKTEEQKRKISEARKNYLKVPKKPSKSIL